MAYQSRSSRIRAAAEKAAVDSAVAEKAAADLEVADLEAMAADTLKFQQNFAKPIISRSSDTQIYC